MNAAGASGVQSTIGRRRRRGGDGRARRCRAFARCACPCVPDDLRDDGLVSEEEQFTHVELIAKNRRTSLIMLATEFLFIGILGAAIGYLVTRSPTYGVAIGALVA